MRIKVFEAFSGYGSQSLALRNIGVSYEVVAISEIDKYALKAYEVLHEGVKNVGDISKVKVEEIPDHDLFTYSFPCQDISVAGKREHYDKWLLKRSSLLWECKRIIEGKKPKYLLMENVKNLVSKKYKEWFDKWCDWLEEQGYTNYYEVLNAKDYGVPQNRERLFMVSILGEHKEYKFPEKTELLTRLKDVLEGEVEEKYYVSEDMKKRFKAKGKKEEKGKEEKAIRLGGCFDKEGRRYQSGSVWDKEGIAPTLDTMQGGYRQPLIIEGIENSRDYKIRKLTPRECFRLMGLSEEDIDKIQGSGVSATQQYKMAGNSIVIPVLEEIFKELLKV